MRVAPPSGVGRLTKRPQFLAVAGSGRRVHTRRMTVQGRSRAADEPGDPPIRVGLTITKREGHATERNRIRRRLRAAAAEALDRGSDLPLDLVLVGRRPALSAGFDLLVEDLRRAAERLQRPDSPTRPKPVRPPSGKPGRTQPSRT